MGDNVTRLPVRLKDTEQIVVVADRYAGCQHGRAIVDEKLAELTCADCGAKLNPIEFIVGLANRERLFKHREESIAAARAALEERRKCRCIKCGEWTPIRRVSNGELTRIRSTSTNQPDHPQRAADAAEGET